MSSPIAYTYDADTHCVDCAIARFGREPGHDWVVESAIDSEGNTVGALAPWDDFGPAPVVCGTCHSIIHAGSGPISEPDLDPDDCQCENCLANLAEQAAQDGNR